MYPKFCPYRELNYTTKIFGTDRCKVETSIFLRDYSSSTMDETVPIPAEDTEIGVGRLFW